MHPGPQEKCCVNTLLLIQALRKCRDARRNMRCSRGAPSNTHKHIAATLPALLLLHK